MSCIAYVKCTDLYDLIDLYSFLMAFVIIYSVNAACFKGIFLLKEQLV